MPEHDPSVLSLSRRSLPILLELTLERSCFGTTTGCESPSYRSDPKRSGTSVQLT